MTVMTWCDYDSMTLKVYLLKRLLVSFWIVVLFGPGLFRVCLVFGSKWRKQFWAEEGAALGQYFSKPCL